MSDWEEMSVEELTRREKEVATALREGCSNRDIAEKLSISPATVKSHLKSILRKTSIPTSRRFIALANRELGDEFL